MVKVKKLRCEQMNAPFGVQSKTPTFSWLLESDEKNVHQETCQIELYQEKNLVWSSEKKEGLDSNSIQYYGPELKHLTEYFWKVTVWDNKGNEASEESRFTTARYDMPWRASWVEPEQMPTREEENDPFNSTEVMAVKSEIRGLDDYNAFQPVHYMRIPFQISKPIKRVVISATAHGVYELMINGKKTDDRFLAPEISAYEKILQYQMYDGTEFVSEGKNVLAIKLADGWWSGRIGYLGNACQYGDKKALLLEGQIEYEDGSIEYILSDTAVSETGPLLAADLFVGEKYDARKELDNWDKPNFDDEAWKLVEKKDYEFDNLKAQQRNPIRIIKSFKPKEIITAPNGDTIIDLGQNIAGFMSFEVEAKEGVVITMEHSEVLDKEGNYYKNIMGENKDQLDVYITKKGKQTYQPVFTYHGFQYVRLSGWPTEPTIDDFTAHVIATDVEDLAKLETSNSKLNKLLDNIWWSQVANTIAIPTDCPQREKVGWTGDVSVYGSTMCLLRDVEKFLREWLENCRKEQLIDGQIPTVVPFYKCYKEMNQYFGSDTSCGWGDAIVIVPWQLYIAYGKKEILEENYESMKCWMNYVQTCAETEVPEDFETYGEEQKARQKYLWNTGFHYADWLVPSMVLNNTDDLAMISTAYATKEVVAPAFYAYSTALMGKIATILGYKEDAIYFADLNEKIRQAFMEEYVNEQGYIKSDMQGIYVLALHHNLITEEVKPKVIKRLLEKIQKNNGCLDTGFLSVTFLLDALCDNGAKEKAFDLLYQEQCPSWLYEVEKGATTIWESWGATSEDGEVGKYSYNHYAYGCVADWMYRKLAGIQAKEAGYKEIRIEPLYDCRLTNVSGEVCTPYGVVKSAWKIEGDTWTMDVKIPVNTTATVVIPDGTEVQVGSGTWKWESK